MTSDGKCAVINCASENIPCDLCLNGFNLTKNGTC
jgi:hypothetical protein